MSISFVELEKTLYNRTKIRLSPSLVEINTAYSILYNLLDTRINKPLYIHVLGTNGKGSTASYIASIAEEYGYSTLLFSSPHLLTMRERIRINSKNISEENCLEASAFIEKHCDTSEILFFEYMLLIAIYQVYTMNIDIVIIEAGLGGEFDSTRILPYTVQAFTSIDYDHEHILGFSLKEIALQKARAIQNTATIISAPQNIMVANILSQVSNNRVVYSSSKKKYTTALAGEHQNINANLASDVWKNICIKNNIPFIFEKIEKAYSNVFIPGRLQTVTMPTLSLDILLDGAHNRAGMERLKQHCLLLSTPIVAVIYSTMYKESLKEIVSLVEDIAKGVDFYYYALNTPRAVSYKSILKYTNITIEESRSLESTIGKIRSKYTVGTILLCGSLYFIGHFFEEYPYLYTYS